MISNLVYSAYTRCAPSEDRDVGLLYLLTKFELVWCTNKVDLVSDRRKETHKHTERLKLILLSNIGLGRVKKNHVKA